VSVVVITVMIGTAVAFSVRANRRDRLAEAPR
jgi:hypothetical protein